MSALKANEVIRIALPLVSSNLLAKRALSSHAIRRCLLQTSRFPPLQVCLGPDWIRSRYDIISFIRNSAYRLSVLRNEVGASTTRPQKSVGPR